jgi:peptidoglycan/LPS O-acetylase OafA/YrhL
MTASHLTSAENSRPDQPQHAAIGYRPDIDGLRSVAVLSVLLFHLGVGPVTGGFVGVDIFFVISGYLIASIIMRESAEGRFSLHRFYIRRVRRIFPALFTMMACTIAIGGEILLPLDYRALGASAVATTLFFSNFYFAAQSGYFGIDGQETPLLHTWSLAVEEQFYIVFPLLMLLALRGRGHRWLLWSTGAASFVYAAWQVGTAPDEAFYLPLSRMWEFLAGVLLAARLIPAITSRAISEVTGLAGAGMIAWAVLGFTSDTSFPGVNALFPVLGAMLLIYAGPDGSQINRALAMRVPVFIGRISYSLYLWHWPIIVFWNYRSDGQWEVGEQLFVFAASLAAATLSWRYIELPFRSSRSDNAGAAAWLAGSGMVGGIGAGALLFLAHGLPARVPAPVAALDAATLSMAHLPERCSGLRAARRGLHCRVGAPHSESPTFLLWGDSHARAIKPAFDRAGTQLGVSGIIASYPACPPLSYMDRLDQAPSHDCSAFNELVFEDLKTMASVHTVILVARWGLCANGTRTEGGKPCELIREGGGGIEANEASLFSAGLETTIARLVAMNKKVVVIAAIPEFRKNVPETLARALLFDRAPQLELSKKDYLVRQKIVFGSLRQIGSRHAIKILYPHQILCRTSKCVTTTRGISLYADDDHLSIAGSLLLSGLAYDALKT